MTFCTIQNKQFKCYVGGCGRLFDKKSDLTRHKNCCHNIGEKKFACLWKGCNKAFAKHCDLTKHVNTRTFFFFGPSQIQVVLDPLEKMFSYNNFPCFVV